MSKPVMTREELIKHADAMLLSHENVLKDKIDALYTKMSVMDCRFFRKIWPNVINMEEVPSDKIYLQTIQADSGQPMSRVSRQIERLQNNGLVLWERGESGTYIQMSNKGFDLYQEQMDILLNYIERVIDKLGEERMKQIIKAIAELESALNSEMPAADAEV
ncbi:MAG: hypothetical protein Q4B03_05610 [Lachnospiraceae bacterium]|nr:hypothetical protein [Lachnospiraceae bacterium]